MPPLLGNTYKFCLLLVLISNDQHENSRKGTNIYHLCKLFIVYFIA